MSTNDTYKVLTSYGTCVAQYERKYDAVERARDYPSAYVIDVKGRVVFETK